MGAHQGRQQGDGDHPRRPDPLDRAGGRVRHPYRRVGSLALLAVAGFVGDALAGGKGGSSGKSSGGTVHVREYTRKDGTHVSAHSRSSPGTASHSSGVSVPAPHVSVVIAPRLDYRAAPRTEARVAARTEAPGVVLGQPPEQPPPEPAPTRPPEQPPAPPAPPPAQPTPPAPVPVVTIPSQPKLPTGADAWLCPSKDGPAPLAVTPAFLDNYLSAREKKSVAGMATWTDRSLVVTVGVPTAVKVEARGPGTSTARPVEGMYKGRTWHVRTEDLRETRPN